ncbi:hypothetical protein AB4Z29_25270 [Paenibacillus sp. 2TAB23]|uniref:hypothetical protein n=1 Tax=Paenibacillus sp. 2TAB23 TaxID=3233004 RepID=UPI003F9AC39D
MLALWRFFSFNAPFIEIVYIMVIINIVYFTRVIYWILFKANKLKIYGYLRFDNVIEMHIGAPKSKREFNSKMRRTIKHAIKEGYIIEFTSGMMTVGEVIRKYGDAVIQIGTPSFISRIFTVVLTMSFVDKNTNYSYEYPIRVKIDPSKLRHSRRRKESVQIEQMYGIRL